MPRPLPVWHLRPASESSRVLVFQGNNLVCAGQAETQTEARRSPAAEMLFTIEGARAIGGAEAELPLEAEPLLIGHWDGEDIYAVALAGDAEHAYPTRPLRAVLNEDPADVGALASTALQLLHWRRDNRFCGRCGGATELLERERAVYCKPCQHRMFPRLSPCVIVAIRRDAEVLLAQHHRAAGQFYSLIAGFVEPGESAEEAVHREVAEETGLRVTNLRYVESETWSFPHQLMLGYIADYEGGELMLEEAELALADWFTKDALPAVPGEWTIAGRLIRYALDGRPG